MEVVSEALVLVLHKFVRQYATTNLPDLLDDPTSKTSLLVTPLHLRTSTLPAAVLARSSESIALDQLIKTLSGVARTPSRLPGYFFVSTRSFSLDVSTEPSTDIAASHWIMEGNQQVLKVEGVIRRRHNGSSSGRRQHHRHQVGRVHVYVWATPAADAQTNATALQRQHSLAHAVAIASSAENPSVPPLAGKPHLSLHLTNVPTDDYFSTTCVLNLNSYLGASSQDVVLTIHVALEEHPSGDIFHTGPNFFIPFQLLKRSS